MGFQIHLERISSNDLYKKFTIHARFVKNTYKETFQTYNELARRTTRKYF